MKNFPIFLLLAGMLALPCRAVSVPVLMYHDFTEDVPGTFAVTAARFDEHLSALEEAGYTSVTFGEVIDYVCFGGELPEKPVLITSDDGYTGVVTLAAEIAGRHGMGISCAVIGELAGTAGHFSPDEGVPDNVELVSHTFALHDREGWDGVVCPDGQEGYEELLAEDCRKMTEILGEIPVMIYPHGAYSAESERVLHELGYAVTVTCDRGVADVRRGEESSLYAMPRVLVWQNMSGEGLLREIERWDF